ncbi:ABC transporter permease subunit [Nakamurella sp.]|uniref:ABC transporter permease subunit n=1 Tax=Nakamurella sp. TaxID=1869182 RepID=UPI003783E269
MTDTAPVVQDEREAPASRSVGAGNLIIKIILVGLIDALLIWCLAQAWTAEWWPAVVFFAIVLIAVNAVYFTKGNLPLKYLVPGLIFLVVYQLFTMFFTGYLSFTNYGTGHFGDKDASIAAIQASNVVPVEGGQEYAVVPIEQDGTVSMLVTDPTTGSVRIGTNEGFTDVPAGDVQRNGEQVTGVTGYQSLNLATLSGSPDLKAQWDALNPPINAEQGTYLRAISITRAREAKSGFAYDQAQDAMINTQTNEVFPANNDDGAFVNQASGQSLNPGWTVGVGFDNYVKLFTDATIRSSFLPILLWTFAFAVLTTFLNFALGLILALILQERRMRGKSIYRVLLIIPYGLPVILTALVWQAMLNSDFGIINQILGANIQWLNDPWLAKFSVLFVNLWMGFPYFFLVCSGALTAVPADLKEAAFVDGASSRYAFRTVVLPLLLVATAPLLITTFAFNFNNFTLINLLTGGGPFSGSTINGGGTDLLINYTLRVAFSPANQQMGLASAIAILIFVIVGTVSAYGFRLTRRLEEIGR